MLHLATSGAGGATVMLRTLAPPVTGQDRNVLTDEWVLASAPPMRGRLVVFPHVCPHAGLPTESAGTKLFLRGELLVKSK
jgi:hypothetical protein